MPRQAYPDCGHGRDKRDRHRRCVVCLGKDHAVAALNGEDPPSDICASMTGESYPVSSLAGYSTDYPAN